MCKGGPESALLVVKGGKAVWMNEWMNEYEYSWVYVGVNEGSD